MSDTKIDEPSELDIEQQIQPVMTPTKPSQAVEHLKSLIDQYWALAYREGTEGRTRDTEDGAAQATLHEINKVIAELARPLEVAAPVTDAELETAYERYSDSLLAGMTCRTAMLRALTKFAASRAPEVVRAEPVAWRRRESDGWWVYYETKLWDDMEPLYTAPPSTAPAEKIVFDNPSYPGWLAAQPKDPAPGPVAVAREIRSGTDDKIIRWRDCPDCQGRGWFCDNPFADKSAQRHHQCVKCETAKTYFDDTGTLPFSASVLPPPGGAGGDVGAIKLQQSLRQMVACATMNGYRGYENALQTARLLLAATPAAEQGDAKGPDSFHSDSGECDRVQVSKEGVRFGKNCWYSHEKITGYNAESLNSGHCGVTGRAYMGWVQANLQPDTPVSASAPDSIDAAARKLYGAWTDNQGIHCNRFPSWSELAPTQKKMWLERAAILAGKATAAGDSDSNSFRLDSGAGCRVQGVMTRGPGRDVSDTSTSGGGPMLCICPVCSAAAGERK